MKQRVKGLLLPKRNSKDASPDIVVSTLDKHSAPKTSSLKRSSNYQGDTAHVKRNSLASCECELLIPEPCCKTLPRMAEMSRHPANRTLFNPHENSICEAHILFEDGNYLLDVIKVNRETEEETVFLAINFAELSTGRLKYDITGDTWHQIQLTTGGHPQEVVLKFSKVPKFEIFYSTLKDAINYTDNGVDKTKEEDSSTKRSPSGSPETSVLLPIIKVEEPVGPKEEENRENSHQIVYQRSDLEFVDRLHSEEIISTDKMEPSLNPSKPDNRIELLMTLIVELTTAVAEGQVQTAQNIVTRLANNKAKLAINLDPEHYKKELRQQEFKVKFYVEDKDASEGPFSMIVKATDTIRDLKNKMQIRFKYPIEVQRWIIGKRIPKDEDTLSKSGVKGEGHCLYLYLVSTKSVGITKQDMDRRMEELSNSLYRANSNNRTPETGDYMTMNANLFNSQFAKQIVQPASPQALLQSPNPNNLLYENISAHTIDPVQEHLPVLDTAEIITSEVQNSQPMQTQQTQQVGWNCPSCTLLNKPTWPGCEVCSAPRPENYKIPSDYVLTPEERNRAEFEKQLDVTTQEATLTGRKPSEGIEENWLIPAEEQKRLANVQALLTADNPNMPLGKENQNKRNIDDAYDEFLRFQGLLKAEHPNVRFDKERQKQRFPNEPISSDDELLVHNMTNSFSDVDDLLD